MKTPLAIPSALAIACGLLVAMPPGVPGQELEAQPYVVTLVNEDAGTYRCRSESGICNKAEIELRLVLFPEKRRFFFSKTLRVVAGGHNESAGGAQGGTYLRDDREVCLKSDGTPGETEYLYGCHLISGKEAVLRVSAVGKDLDETMAEAGLEPTRQTYVLRREPYERGEP